MFSEAHIYSTMHSVHNFNIPFVNNTSKSMTEISYREEIKN